MATTLGSNAKILTISKVKYETENYLLNELWASALSAAALVDVLCAAAAVVVTAAAAEDVAA